MKNKVFAFVLLASAACIQNAFAVKAGPGTSLICSSISASYTGACYCGNGACNFVDGQVTVNPGDDCSTSDSGCTFRDCTSTNRCYCGTSVPASCDGGGTGCNSLLCPTDSQWQSGTNGVEYKRTCDSSTCSVSYTYRCAVGYYGNPTSTSSGCTACGNGATSAAGTTSQSGCYIPSGSAFSDSTGSGSYTDDCYY